MEGAAHNTMHNTPRSISQIHQVSLSIQETSQGRHDTVVGYFPSFSGHSGLGHHRCDSHPWSLWPERAIYPHSVT